MPILQQERLQAQRCARRRSNPARTVAAAALLLPPTSPQHQNPLARLPSSPPPPILSLRQNSKSTAGAPSDTVVRGKAPDAFKQGNVLAGGRYKLGSKVHDGRFATVWLGSDKTKGGKEVVLKVRRLGWRTIGRRAVWEIGGAARSWGGMQPHRPCST
jgi:hypothetical protein